MNLPEPGCKHASALLDTRLQGASENRGEKVTEKMRNRFEGLVEK